MLPVLIKLAYVVSAVLFILGLKFMGHPRTAVRGNLFGAAGMLLAIVVTLVDPAVAWSKPVIVGLLLFGMAVGTVAGLWLARFTPMTSMPQLVALFNGFGGAASVFVAGGELLKGPMSGHDALLATAMSGLIGAVTFWGSLVAYGKLQELKAFKKPFAFDGQKAVNGFLAAVCLLIVIMMTVLIGDANWPVSVGLYVALCVFATGLGLMLVLPIGGADMPVVIALLNSYSGLAAAATGFVINNNVLIIAGSLVGASGLILTQLMCKAMNRSLANVIFGGIDASGGDGPDAEEVYATVRSTSADDVAMLLEDAQRVVFVPGYGMAVAQAQHAVRDLAKQLEKEGADVEYAIHPVAGRMPGHMNVLLAEADVPYEQLREMDDINPTLSQVDVAIIIGANDVVNPVANTDPNSPIAGMPIIEVDQARTVIVIKRSLSPGFAGIPNPLFAADNALMLFGDGQAAVRDITAAMKEL